MPRATRTYYVTEGLPLCSRHYDCACEGREAPVVSARRPRWPASNRYVRVRAASEGLAVTLATTAPQRVCYSGGIPRQVAPGHDGRATEPTRTDLSDAEDHD